MARNRGRECISSLCKIENIFIQMREIDITFTESSILELMERGKYSVLCLLVFSAILSFQNELP